MANATKTRKTSPTNMVTARPKDKKAPANVSGTLGHAFAITLIRETEERAQQEMRVQTSLKDRLMELFHLGRDDQLTFRADLAARVQQIGDSAKAAKQSVAEYRAKNAVSNYIYTQLSIWKRFSLAIEAGWQPDVSMAWNNINNAATQHLDATGKPDSELLQKRAAIVGDTKLNDEQRNEMVKEIDEQIKATTQAATAQPNARKRGGRPSVSNVDKAKKMLEAYPMQDLEILYVWLGEHITGLKAKASGKREVAATPSNREVKKGVVGKQREHATASK